jgi:transcriptional regulator with XRE-family HTH domain
MTTLATNDLVSLSHTRKIVDTGQLRRVRQRAGLTQAELAEAVGVTSGAVCRWELGDIRPTSARARRLADVLNVLEASNAH